MRARKVAVLEEEVPDLSRPDWNVDLRTERSGAPRASSKSGRHRSQNIRGASWTCPRLRGGVGLRNRRTAPRFGGHRAAWSATEIIRKDTDSSQAGPCRASDELPRL